MVLVHSCMVVLLLVALLMTSGVHMSSICFRFLPPLKAACEVEVEVVMEDVLVVRAAVEGRLVESVMRAAIDEWLVEGAVNAEVDGWLVEGVVRAAVEGRQQPPV